jgi:PilZ domain
MRREARKQPRKAIRFPLEAPIVFRWTDSGIEKQGEGRTHDISEVGAFVLSSICPPLGTEINFNIFLPVLPGFEPKTRVEAVGRVLRIEQSRGIEGRDGFAILSRHTLLRVSDGQTAP